jgi:hypothetical protein
VTAGAIEDLSGKAYTGISNATTWNFISVDTTTPSKVSLSPADNATDVSIGDDLIITFSENVQADVASYGFRIYKADNTLIETIPANDSQITYSENVVTINPTADFLYNTGYYINIDTDAIDDFAYAGNNYAGISSNSGWNFTTGSAKDHFFWGGD